MKKIFGFVLIILCFICLIFVSGKLVSLKYINEFPEGSFISDYYKEVNNHDVIILGDCEAYTSFSPIELYEKYGITSYIRGNSQQLIGQSYYVLSETLKYETPKVVLLSVGGMRYDKQKKEEYNRLMIDKMKWSMDKFNLIKYSMLDNENIWTYVIPLLRYHNRITSLNRDDFKYLFHDEIVSHNGFLINQEVKPLTVLPNKLPLSNYKFSDSNYIYLEKIINLCKDNNIKLILYKSPTVYPFWYDEYEEQIKTIANKYSLPYYNFITLNDEINIDFNYDTYDSGVHLNLSGARKLTNYLGNILINDYHLNDYRNNVKIKSDYMEKIRRYYEEINKGNN